MGKVIDITGQKFGKLTVIREEGRTKEGRATWLCQCDCGNTKVIKGKALRKGTTKSCGCIVNKHNMTNSYTWSSWRSMMRRCYETNNERYTRYGEKGITVDTRWHEFINFYKDMGERPLNTTLDRINNDGNYEPGNCRWASNQTQNNNRGSFNTRLILNGVEKTINEWSRELNIKPSALHERLSRGWSVEKTLTTPCKSFTKIKTLWTYKETDKTLGEWAKLYNIRLDTLTRRLESGWDLPKALETPTRKITKT